MAPGAFTAAFGHPLPYAEADASAALIAFGRH